jgi:hypothetical protein
MKFSNNTVIIAAAILLGALGASPAFCQYYQRPDYGGTRYIPLSGPPAGMMNMAYYRPPSSQQISRAVNVWQNMVHSGAPSVEQGGSNPFNLNPFGILHYLWDDTTYVSQSNPVALYGVQNDLQRVQQFSTMAQSAAKRARYAADPQERQQANAQAHYYAQQAQLIASHAQQTAAAGSLDPASVAAMAAQEANNASQAVKRSTPGF